jgi:hypothetical protein
VLQGVRSRLSVLLHMLEKHSAVDCMGDAAVLYEAHQRSSACHCVKCAFTKQCAKAPVYVHLAVASELPYTVAACCWPAFRLSPHAACYHLHLCFTARAWLTDVHSRLGECVSKYIHVPRMAGADGVDAMA